MELKHIESGQASPTHVGAADWPSIAQSKNSVKLVHRSTTRQQQSGLLRTNNRRLKTIVWCAVSADVAFLRSPSFQSLAELSVLHDTIYRHGEAAACT